MRSHLDIANSIHNLSELAKAYQNGRFPLETNDSILGVTLSQFGTTLEEISSWHQIQAQQLQVGLFAAPNKTLGTSVLMRPIWPRLLGCGGGGGGEGLRASDFGGRLSSNLGKSVNNYQSHGTKSKSLRRPFNASWMQQHPTSWPFLWIFFHVKDSMVVPLKNFLKTDMEELTSLQGMTKLSEDEMEVALCKHSKLSKRDSEKKKLETNQEVRQS